MKWCALYLQHTPPATAMTIYGTARYRITVQAGHSIYSISRLNRKAVKKKSVFFFEWSYEKPDAAISTMPPQSDKYQHCILDRIHMQHLIGHFNICFC